MSDGVAPWDRVARFMPSRPPAPSLTVPQMARLLDYHGAGLTDEAVASAMRGHGVVMDAGHVRRALDLLGELLERKL